MKKKLSILLYLSAIALTLSVPGYAIPESDYQTVYENAVMPHFEQGESGSFYGVDNKKIAYVKIEAADEVGAIVILPGKSESYFKYAELVYDLKETGYSFYVMDNRGFGLSERLLADPVKNYVESYTDYCADLKYFMDHVVNARPHAKRYLIGHSMGGGIAALYLERYPEAFDGAILSSPMVHINTGSFPEPLAYPTLVSLCLIGQGEAFAPGYTPGTAPKIFEENRVTRSRARYEMFNRVIAPQYPELYHGSQVSGDTSRYCRELLELTYEVQAYAWRIKVPVLMLQAGEDNWVKPFGQDAFIAHVRNGKKVVFPTARHEILQETDDIYYAALDQIIDFIEAN